MRGSRRTRAWALIRLSTWCLFCLRFDGFVCLARSFGGFFVPSESYVRATSARIKASGTEKRVRGSCLNEVFPPHDHDLPHYAPPPPHYRCGRPKQSSCC